MLIFEKVWGHENYRRCRGGALKIIRVEGGSIIIEGQKYCRGDQFLAKNVHFGRKNSDFYEKKNRFRWENIEKKRKFSSINGRKSV